MLGPECFSAWLMHAGSSSSQTASSLLFRLGRAMSLPKMSSSTRELQNELKARNSRILYLEQELARKNDRIKILESELDKYRSVLHPPTANTKARPRQGISAEPASFKTGGADFKPLAKHAKNQRQVLFMQ